MPDGGFSQPSRTASSERVCLTPHGIWLGFTIYLFGVFSLRRSHRSYCDKAMHATRTLSASYALGLLLHEYLLLKRILILGGHLTCATESTPALPGAPNLWNLPLRVQKPCAFMTPPTLSKPVLSGRPSEYTS